VRIRIPTGLILAAVFASLYGCASAVSGGYGQGGRSDDGRSYAEARADNQITAAVNTLLVKDKRIRAMDIQVSTFNGVVSLDGSVPDHSAAAVAQSLAASIEGVRWVDNNLQVSP
jgi:hyperosmotically inducible protein